MNLNKKKKLAERTFGIGKSRIVFVDSRLEDIKEAITKQDIRDLYKDGAIIIKEKIGRKKIIKKRNRSTGNIRKKIKKRKKDYVILTRKLRRYILDMKKQEKISNVNLKDIRKKIRNKTFKNKMQLREQIEGVKNRGYVK
ncbi:MAG: 50S ribosomal protein L19e [Nanoarchaeota archaeon]